MLESFESVRLRLPSLLFFFRLSLSLRPVAVSAAQRPTRRTFFLASRFSLKKANNLGAPHSPRQGKMQHRNFFARLPHRSLERTPEKWPKNPPTSADPQLVICNDPLAVLKRKMHENEFFGREKKTEKRTSDEEAKASQSPYLLFNWLPYKAV
jgi:hypothetical protein